MRLARGFGRHHSKPFRKDARVWNALRAASGQVHSDKQAECSSSMRNDPHSERTLAFFRLDGQYNKKANPSRN